MSAILVFGLLSLPARGQVADGLVGGMTRDSVSGKPVPEVQIVAHNLDKNIDESTASDADGMYRFTNLEAGRYDVAATKNGFQKASETIDVEARQVVRVDLSLRAAADPPATAAKSDIEPISDYEKELLDRIENLEQRLAAMDGELTRHSLTASANPADVSAAAASSASLPPSQTAAPSPVPANLPPLPEGLQSLTLTQGVDNFTPFALGDSSWKNGTGRGQPVFSTKFFTPEIRFDTNFIEDFDQPRDHSMGGSTEEYRSGEFQIEQASVGGDFRWENVRGRILVMFGEFATTTWRNDGSNGVGQWNLEDAYKYVSEAWGGYSFNVNHGLNIDAGIFVSYIGLFASYNFDNWAYQPSYVSSNTPWFFNGIRIQWFPTNKFKIEPWIINGWQSYGKFNSRMGLGGQILYSPTEWLSLVFNNYGMGTDTLNDPGVSRIHADYSYLVRYFHRSESPGISTMAFSITTDLGCEYGGGASCYKNTANGLKTSFAGWMAYNRMWWAKDHHAITIGGGTMNNPGRYLTLLPPINNADAVTGSPYFTENFGQPAKMWDGTITYQWMPKQWITWWAEAGYRHSDIPYWTGRDGITPPGGNTSSPASYVCSNGVASQVSAFAPSGAGFAVDNTGNAVSASCTAEYGAGWTAWQPDLRKDQAALGAGVMVRF
jgi:hypothetical protein